MALLDFEKQKNSSLAKGKKLSGLAPVLNFLAVHY